MLISLTKRLRLEKLSCGKVYLHIRYSKTIGNEFSVSKKLDNQTTDIDKLYIIIKNLFDKNYEEDMPIRQVNIGLSKLEKDCYIQLNLFENINIVNKKNNLDKALDQISLKYGNNSILNATSLLNTSTIKLRNTKIGGHNAG